MVENNNGKVVRARGFAVQRSYLYDIQEKADDGTLYTPKDAMTEADWKAMIIEQWSEYINKNAEVGGFIFHDNDFDPDDGQPKPLHAHAVLRFKNARTQSSVMKAFGTTLSSNVSPVESYVNAYRYLTHISESAINDKKTIYPASDVYMFNADYLDVIVRTTDSKSKRSDRTKIDEYIASLHIRILTEGLTAREAKNEIFSEFNKDPMAVNAYIKARQSFERDMTVYDEERAERLLRDGRDLTSVYVQGEGGIGKTKLARAMALLKADGRGYHAAAQDTSNKTFDFADKYKGELVSVFDEIQPQSFQASEFLGIFDPRNYTPVGSRNSDKDWLAEYALFTSSLDFFKWRYDLIRYSYHGERYVHPLTGAVLKHEDDVESFFWQVTRRFASMVTLEFNEIGEVMAHVYTLNKTRRGYSYIGSICSVSDFYMNKPKDSVDIDGQIYNATDAFAHGVWTLIEKGLSTDDDLVIHDDVLFQSDTDIDLTSFGGQRYAPIKLPEPKKTIQHNVIRETPQHIRDIFK